MSLSDYQERKAIKKEDIKDFSYACSAKDCFMPALYIHKGLRLYLCEDHAALLSYRNCDLVNETEY